jgi:hypothetical protein
MCLNCPLNPTELGSPRRPCGGVHPADGLRAPSPNDHATHTHIHKCRSKRPKAARPLLLQLIAAPIRARTSDGKHAWKKRKNAVCRTPIRLYTVEAMGAMGRAPTETINRARAWHHLFHSVQKRGCSALLRTHSTVYSTPLHAPYSCAPLHIPLHCAYSTPLALHITMCNSTASLRSTRIQSSAPHSSPHTPPLPPPRETPMLAACSFRDSRRNRWLIVHGARNNDAWPQPHINA